MPQLKRKRDLWPNYYLNFKSDEPEELNQRFNTVPGLNVTSGNESKLVGSTNPNYQTGTPRQPNVKSEEEFLGGNIQPKNGYYVPKRPRVEAAIKLSPPWSRRPGFQPFCNSTLPANAILHQNVPTTQRNISSTYVDKAAETISGCSDLLYNMSAQDLGTSSKPKPTKVFCFDDLMNFPTRERKIQTKDIAEPIKCDEEAKCQVNAKRNKRNVSVVERFTDEEINLHLMSLKEGSSGQVNLKKEVVVTTSSVPQSGIREASDLKKEEKDDICQLCDGGKLYFPQPTIFCSYCINRIDKSALYYILEEGLSDIQIQICSQCFKRCKRKFPLYGINIIKDQMLQVSNVETIDDLMAEEWVQCGYCKEWQHQICGLYNKHKDTNNNADYICPKCLLVERESNNNSGFDDNTDLGAKDLPESILSYFIEQRLFRRLKEERDQTAKATGKSINEVLEPEDLTVRVVFSADKTTIVTKMFADLLHKENFPSELPYRSKVILLFQKIEGVDVCIFSMFVQEFGSECSQPNQRSTYIGYLDSVKYFRPERVTFSGEALRTFVYHEILIGYLEYCKLRGFTTSYIWVCPPKVGEDYIMYSHPKTQHTPCTKKLSQWYVTLLDKAVEQSAVANVTDLHERFFAGKDEYTLTAARLPYFEGCYWSCQAENLIYEIEVEGKNVLPKMVKSLHRKRLKGLSYRSNGCVDIDDAKNILMMQKLERKVSKNKEEFMVVDLNYSCTRCSKAILSGLRWFCKKCKNLHLCESCYDTEHELPGEHIHTKNSKVKHELSKVHVKGISSTTEDNDIIQVNDIFESRQAFLAFSKQNNYGFDTLRRAKFTSMMILHQLHTSNKHHCSQTSSRLACGDCGKNVSETIYFLCLICPSFLLCTGCYNKKTIHLHLHLFPLLPTVIGVTPKTVMVLEILNALTHVHQCQTTATKSFCSYPKCNEVKMLFYHSAQCRKKEKEKRACCKICNKLGKVLRIHSNHCNDLECPVQGCIEIKDFWFRKKIQDKDVKG